MKTIFFYSSLLITLFFIPFTSCNEDETYIPDNLSIIQFEVLEETPLVTYPEDTLNFSLKLTSEIAIKSISATLDGVVLESSDIVLPLNTLDTEYGFKYIVKQNEVGRTLDFIISAFDENDKKSIKEYLVYVQSPEAEIVITLPDELPETVIFDNTLEFDVSVISGFPLKSIKTYLNNIEIVDLTKEIFNDPTSDTYHFSYTPSLAEIGQDLTFTFEVMDSFGKIQALDYTITVIRGDVVLDINEFYGIRLGAQNSTEAGPFLNATTGVAHPYLGVATISETIDLVTFYSGSTYAFNITSPTRESVASFIYRTGDDAMANWTTRNYTAIKMLNVFSSEEFIAIDNYASIQTLFDNAGTELDTTPGLKDGSVFTFRTAQGKYGIIIVRSRSANANTGYITVDMKIQK